MAMKARYTVINGEIIAEKRGGVRRLYVPDALGSTVALLDSNQAQTDTFEYWPYGEERARTGTTPTPFRFGGTLGYYRDGSARSYVRGRHLDTARGQWLTEDPTGIGAGETSLYAYASNTPATVPDPSGFQPAAAQPGECFGCLQLIESTRKMTCAEICDIARRSPAIDKTGGGSPICYSYKMCACLFDWPPNQPWRVVGACPEMDKCAYAHEQAHFPEAVRCDPCRGIQQPGFRPGVRPVEAECAHRAAEVTCLRQALRRSSAACQGTIRRIMAYQGGWIRANCPRRVPRRGGGTR